MPWNCTKCDRSFDTYLSFAHHWSRGHEGTGQPLAEYLGRERLERLYKSNSENALAEELGVSRTAIHRALDYCDIERRGQSEAEELKWEQMSDEERQQQVQAAHEATRTLPRLDVSVRGYERIRHGSHEVKHHRLLATLLVGDLEELKDRVVHHEIPVWPDGPAEVAQAVNYFNNLELLQKDEHMRNHIKAGDIPRDDVTGQFKYERQ